MTIQFPLEVWEAADRYADVIIELRQVIAAEDFKAAIAAIDKVIVASRHLKDTIEPHLTTDVTIVAKDSIVSEDTLLTIYRDPLKPSALCVVTSELVTRPTIDRTSVTQEPTDDRYSEWRMFRKAHPIDTLGPVISDCGPDDDEWATDYD